MSFRNVTNEAPMSPRYARYWTTDGMQVVPYHSDYYDWKSKLPYRIDPNAISSAQLFPLGTELHYAERSWRYAKAGSPALAVGKLMQSVVPLAGHIDEVVGTTAIGDTTITFTPNTGTTDDLAENELADGYIHINASTGAGYTYRIKSHPAITGATVGTLTLYDPIVVATTTGASKATVYHNRFRNVILHPSPPTAMVCGVTVAAVTANYYCWLQYRGPCAVLTDGTVVAGDHVVPSTGTDGAVMASVAFETDGPVIGYVAAVNATTEYSLIHLAMM